MSGLSVATITSPEFINISPIDINPLISKCEIKVLYVGANRNMSFISKETATEMAKTLPGTPIVGYYSENKEDFGDHGDQLIIDGDGIRFNCLTKPYGFVPPDTKVWFKEFEDTDEFGNKIIREYLMCEGYLWTEQYEEAKKVINEGRPHSMELDEKTLKGHWSTDNNRGIEFFIINDAIFSKLCILGEDVEPCFEGSSVTAPEVSSTFSFKADEFTSTLFTMMKELKELTYSLQNKGGNSMENLNEEIQNPENYVKLDAEEVTAPVVEEVAAPVEDVAPIADPEPIVEETTVEESHEDALEIVDDKVDEVVEDSAEDEDNSEDEEEVEEDAEDKYTVLEQQFNELNEKYASLEKLNEELLAFKKNVEDKEKDELINSFYMLSDEDKKSVIENKSKYSLVEIEKELSVICVRKKVSFEDNSNTAQQPSLVYNIHDNNVENASLPAWLQAVEQVKNGNN